MHETRVVHIAGGGELNPPTVMLSESEDPDELVGGASRRLGTWTL